MANKQGMIPLFIEMMNHQAFFRYEPNTWPGVGYFWVVYCPGCEHMALAIKENAADAAEVALSHRIDYDAWIPPEEIPHGPVAKWGTTR